MNLTKLVTAEAHVVNNNFVGKDKQGDMPQPNGSTPGSRIEIS